MNNRERGAALIVIMAGMSLVLLLLLTGLTMTSFSGQALKRQLTYQGQALNAASAGLEEGLSWFKRQNQQPVAAFTPLLDVGGVCTHNPPHNPPIIDTEDPAVGLVREYELSTVGRLRGRYELRVAEVTDVSRERGKAATSDGTMWHLVSRGAVYVDNDNSVPFDQAPNVVLARRTMETDIQRLQIRLPAEAAIFSSRGNRFSLNAGVRVRGGIQAGLAYANGTNTPTIPAGTVTGNPQHTSVLIPPAAYDIPYVFALTRQELIATADVVVPSAAVGVLPPVLPAMGLVVITGNAVFGPTAPNQPLSGSGVLVVFGNLTIQQNSLSLFNGLIYVEGTVSIAEPVTINGAIIAATPPATAGNYVTLSGGADFVEINYDNSFLNQMRQQMGQYRFTRSFYISNR
jgi:hypothetical protein